MHLVRGRSVWALSHTVLGLNPAASAWGCVTVASLWPF